MDEKIKETNENKQFAGFLVVLTIILILLYFGLNKIFVNIGSDTNTLNILSSYENEYLEANIVSYAEKNNIKVKFTYMGDLDIVTELNSNSKKYDAVWISNSMWLYMLDNPYLTSESQSVSISPVAIGIKKSKAEELNLVGKDITNTDFLNLIKNKKIKYVMSSVTKTNTGATAYFGFLNSLAGNPEVLTTDMLNNETLINDLTTIFSGVERVSGDEDYLEKMFVNSDKYEAVIADESALININKTLVSKNKEPLYLLYPTDGVAINDSTFAFIANDTNKKDNFLKIQSYLLSGKGQKMLEESGRRTWYGGIKKNVNKKVFNPKWGIDTSKYLNVVKFPSKSVMTAAINLYIEKLRKPTHIVFCLDYSGSMYDRGITELRSAMDYILDYNKASADELQFSDKDKITVITFSTEVNNVWSTDNGKDTAQLISDVDNANVGGSTALYDAIERGLEELNKDTSDSTKTIIAMTDGEANMGSFEELEDYYKKLDSSVPIYSITFGSASVDQLDLIANLSNAKVFDGTTSLLKAFKEVRGYN